MQKTIIINNITGASDFDIWLCDNPKTFCQWIDTITNLDLPYTFIIPQTMQNLSSYRLEIIDNNECIINLILS